MEPGRQAAPGPLELVRRFVNTIDIEGGSDELAAPDQLSAWLTANGLLAADERLGLADLQRAVEVREALRALLLANGGSDLDSAAIQTLNRAARNARLVVQFDAQGHCTLEPEPAGVEQALGRILAIAYTAMTEGTWPRLKACANDECQWAFFDHSKNRSGRWCTMADCGNTMKARAYRERHRNPAARERTRP